MKDIYKNPVFYYVLAPVLVALWPLLLRTVWLPGAGKSWNLEKKQYEDSQAVITEILTLDPERVEFANTKNAKAEFDYAIAVEKIASLCQIPASNYNLSSGMVVTTSKQKSQSAKVGLKQVDIGKSARFLSMIQLRWAKLQCVQVKLDKKKGLPDMWDIDLDFKYYF
jgi:hypothetical protein